MTYTEQQIAQFGDHHAEWLRREDELTTRMVTRNFRQDETPEFVRHGLSRRLATLKHSLDRVFEALPPDEQQPSREALMDATSHLQTFVINVFGAIDNLARIWVMEAQIKQPNGRDLRPMQIGLTPDHGVVRATLSQRFRDHLATTDAWFGYLEDYRHALAHRIPLYIPPRQLDDEAAAEFRRLEEEMVAAMRDRERYDGLRAEQSRLGVFTPLMMHSYGEAARPVYLHPQMICDFATVVEIGEYLLRELDDLQPAQP